MRFHQTHSLATRPQAFTLVELLVVVAIIATLAALVFPAVNKVKDSAAQTREIHAARQIMVGFANYAASNDGELVSGYNTSVTSITMPGGTEISGIMCARYPWRLAPYLGNQVDEVFLINEARRKTAGIRTDSFDYQYRASLSPALGINAYCVGGVADGSTNFQNDVIRRMGGTSYAATIVAFVSARTTENEGGKTKSVMGFHMVKPPRMATGNWQTKWDPTKPAGAFGNVDFRWSDKAVCAFLDGHVEMLGEKELQDMQRWSNAAAEARNPYHMLAR